MASFQRIQHALAVSGRKVAVPPTAAFRGIFQDYRDKWKNAVEAVGSDWLAVQLDDWLKNLDVDKLQAVNPDLAGKLLGPPDFDPSTENAYDLIGDIFWWADTMMENREGTDAGDDLHKALQAWDHFEKIIGVDLQRIWHRWSKAQTVFVPPHVAAAHGPEEMGGLFDLLNEAHKAFVFGAHGAAIAMCRALTEIVLVKHYGLGEGDLKDVIILAENRHPWVRPLKLQNMRKLANGVLHRSEKASEDAVITFLATVRELIEKAPAKAS